MITAWQLASLPVWAFGFFFMVLALPVGCGFGKRPGETSADFGRQMITAIVLGVALLITAAWMWS